MSPDRMRTGTLWARLVTWAPFLAPWSYALESPCRTVQCNHALGHFSWCRLVAYDTLWLHFWSHFRLVVWMAADLFVVSPWCAYHIPLHILLSPFVTVRQWLGAIIMSLLATGKSRRVCHAASPLTTGSRQRR
jgi:hypothetical protein